MWYKFLWSLWQHMAKDWWLSYGFASQFNLPNFHMNYIKNTLILSSKPNLCHDIFLDTEHLDEIKCTYIITNFNCNLWSSWYIYTKNDVPMGSPLGPISPNF